MRVNPEIKRYIELQVFPKYDKFYAHGLLHIDNVIKNALMLAKYYNLNLDIAYVAAAYHDLGLSNSRSNHEYESGKLLKNDVMLKQFFDEGQINIMKEAIEDHRGSRKEPPRNFYGKILSDSDRDFDIRILAKRQLPTSIKNYPEMRGFDQHFERCYRYLLQRRNSSMNFNLWTNNPVLVERRARFQKDFFNKEYAKSVYKTEWDYLQNSDLMDKILNYYEDY